MKIAPAAEVPRKQVLESVAFEIGDDGRRRSVIKVALKDMTTDWPASVRSGKLSEEHRAITLFGRLVGFERRNSQGNHKHTKRTLVTWKLHTDDGKVIDPTPFEIAMWRRLPKKIRMPADQSSSKPVEPTKNPKDMTVDELLACFGDLSE